MIVQFKKYHGTGNDFILLDGRNNDIPILDSASIRHFCNRHFGIGADGLMVLKEASGADFEMMYYNSDGLPGTMCGNGGRCITAFAHSLGMFREKCTFKAADGLHTGEMLQNGDVRLSMNDVTRIERAKDGYFLDTGSPHYIAFFTDIDSIDVFSRGREMRNDPEFGEGTNVNFVEVHGDSIHVRTYERGVEDETLSCGTGVTAAAIAAHVNDPVLRPPLRVETRGGILIVDFKFNTAATDISLTGPAQFVFEGTIETSGL